MRESTMTDREVKVKKINMDRIMKMRILMLILAAQMMQSNPLFAKQEGGDFMRSMGMIYVVVAVILVALAGVAIFLFSLERRVRKLEEHLNSK
jgi:hypothetical protein